jgi:hypothetical protein
MGREEFEKIALSERQVRFADKKHKPLRGRAHEHRGVLSGVQADELRLFLRDQSTGARHLVDFERSGYFTKDGDLVVPRVRWWLKVVDGRAGC